MNERNYSPWKKLQNHLLSRRNLFRAAAGSALGAGLLRPKLAYAGEEDDDSERGSARPNPIPGGFPGLAPFGIFVHHNPLKVTTPLAKISDPSQITSKLQKRIGGIMKKMLLCAPAFTKRSVCTFSFALLLAAALFPAFVAAQSLSLACNCVVATIPVEKGPGVVGVNPLTNLMYVSNIGNPEGNGDTVSVINGATNTVVATIRVGKGPAQIGVNPVTNLIYVPNRGASANGNTVSVINGATNTVVATIEVAEAPESAAVNPVTNMIYVTSVGHPFGTGNTVSVINGATNTVVATIAVGMGPFGVAVNPVTNLVYVSNVGVPPTGFGNTVSVINGATNTVVATIPVGTGPAGVGVNPLTNLIYVANHGSNTVSVIDGATKTIVATIPVATPFLLGVNPKTHLIYISQPGIPLGTDNAVSVINGATNAVVSTITVGTGPFGVGVNPATNMIYVANHFSDTVSVISGEWSIKYAATDAACWNSEVRLTDSSFNMEAVVPNLPRGFFVGDYFGLAAAGNSLVTVFTQVDNQNVTSIFARRVVP